MQNVLSASFDQTDPNNMRVVFRTPPLLAANARPALVFDPGLGSPTVQTNNTGKITHTYLAAAIVTATLTDVDGGDCGRATFEVPRGAVGPYTIGPAATYPG